MVNAYTYSHVTGFGHIPNPHILAQRNYIGILDPMPGTCSPSVSAHGYRKYERSQSQNMLPWTSSNLSLWPFCTFVGGLW